jgi:sugar transferase (PEP-CTERM/EpsH1 system associated)
MRILWLKSDLLLPLDKGGKLRTWHLMRHLARRHAITYLAFADPAAPAAHLDGMHEVAASVHTIPRPEVRKGSPRFYANVTRHVADRVPYAVAQYRSSAYRQRVQSLLDTGAFDLVVADFLFSAINLPRRVPCPVVLFTHNVESEIWRRHAETASGQLRRALFASQYRRMMRYEGQALRRFDALLAVSETDRQTFARLYPGMQRGPMYVVPTGVDTEYFAPDPTSDAGTELVFTGSMDWLPNEDAMLWFCRDVLPLIRRQVPTVRLSIVGRAPTPAVTRLAADSGVHVTGRVDDVRPYMRAAALYVVPLRIGGGTRLKIFEAMAMAKAVVSTTVGAEGLAVTHGRDVLLADGAPDFARSVVQLLSDMDQRRHLGRAARALVVEHFDWSTVARDLDTALLRVASQSAARHPETALNLAGYRSAHIDERLV